MSEYDDHEARIFRAALPGWQRPPETEGPPMLYAPGRAALELAVLLAALAILVPVCGGGALAASWSARRAGNSRGSVALLLAGWCTLLGLAVRAALGLAWLP